jgi:hypothetical protein
MMTDSNPQKCFGVAITYNRQKVGNGRSAATRLYLSCCSYWRSLGGLEPVFAVRDTKRYAVAPRPALHLQKSNRSRANAANSGSFHGNSGNLSSHEAARICNHRASSHPSGRYSPRPGIQPLCDASNALTLPPPSRSLALQSITPPMPIMPTKHSPRGALKARCRACENAST